MIRAALVIVVLSAGAAFAQPAAKPKAVPNKYLQAAGQAFNAALAADAENQLDTASGLYVKAFQIQPHPATAYNLADVERRRGHIDEAIEYYEVYLLLSPDAPDAADVRKQIAKLEATPALIQLHSDPPSNPNSIEFTPAYILFDGQIVKKAGVPGAIDASTSEPKLDLLGPGRKFRISVVSEITYGFEPCDASPGKKRKCHILAPPRVDGNVVIDSPLHPKVDVVTSRGDDIANKRAALPPGKQSLLLREGKVDCQRLIIDVPSNGDVLFVFVSGEADGYPDRCRKLSVKQHRLAF